MPQHPAPWPALLTGRGDTTFPLESGNHTHLVPLGSFLASLPRPPYPPPSPPPPPPEPSPPPRPRSTRVCASWTVMFIRQGLSRATYCSQLWLPLISSSDHATTIFLQFGEFPSGLALMGTAVGADVTSLMREGPWIFVGLQNAVKVSSYLTLFCFDV